MGESQSIEWLYQMTALTSTKQGQRLFTPYGLAYDLIGFDGSVWGGPRPHYGFTHVVDLDGVAETGFTARQTLVMFEPVSFRVGVSGTGWGFLYGVWDTSTQKLVLFLKYRVNASTTWVTKTLRTFTGVDDADERAYSAIVQGQFVYAFVEGKEPTLFYYDSDTNDIIVAADTGPGQQPVFSTSEGVIITPSGTVPFGSGQTDEGVPLYVTGADVLNMVEVPTDGQPSKAKLFQVIFSGLTTWVDDAGVTNLMDGPTDLSLWGTPPAGQEDPEWNDTSPPQSRTQWVTGLGPLPGQNSRTTRPPSYYNFAYQLYDSVTGRKSQLSEVTAFSFGAPYPGLAYNAQGEYICFALVELVYDSSKYDSVQFYRSVRGLNGTRNFVLQLDGDVALDDYEATSQAGMTGTWKRAYYLYMLIDPVLAAQDTFQGDLLYDDEMPTAGAALLYDGLAVFGRTREFDVARGGMGLIRWSNPFDINLEQVSPFNKFFLSSPNEEIVGFVEAGTNVIAYTLNRLYHGRKENFVVKWTPLQIGYGGVGFKGKASFGSDAMVVAESGVKLVSDRGALSNVEVLDDLVQRQWAGTVQGVQIAFDAVAECFYVLNPEEETAALLWVKTSQMTELHDMNFDHVREGKVPLDWASNNNNYKPRACFVQKVEIDGASGDPQWRVFVPDYRRQKSRRGLHLDPDSTDVRVSLGVNFVSGTMLQTSVTDFTDSDRLERCRLYVMEGENASGVDMAGRYATIRRVVDTDMLELESDASNLHGLQSGARLGLSPMYARWTGHGVGMVRENEDDPNIQPYDYSRLRHVSALQCVFTNVTGDASTELAAKDNRFFAYIWKGNAEQWIGYPLRNTPVHPNGMKHASVVDGPGLVGCRFGENGTGVQGASLFPSVEIICPELDYYLVNVIVSGSVRAARTESFLSVTPPT